MLYDPEFWFHAREIFLFLCICYIVTT